MRNGQFQVETFACGESHHSAQAQMGSSGSLNQQQCLHFEPSPEEGETLARRSALENLKKAVEAQPDSAWAWYQYGDALLGLKRAEEAVPALRKAVELSPETAIFHYDLGLALYDLNHSEAASVEFAVIVANDPNLKSASSSLMLAAMTNLALSQGKLGRHDEAIQTLLPAQESAVGILFNLGFLHFRAKRFDVAAPYAQAAYILKPNNEDIVHLYGSTLNELGRPREAIKLLKLATELDPTCVSAWYDLGLAFARLKFRKRARVSLQRSLLLAPHHAWSYYDLACLDALEGKREEAFDNLRQAVACGFRKIGHMRQDSDLRSLRRDSRWRDLLNTIGTLVNSSN